MSDEEAAKQKELELSEESLSKNDGADGSSGDLSFAKDGGAPEFLNGKENLDQQSKLAIISQHGTLTNAIYAAASDLPVFRKGIMDLDDQLDEFSRWWESIHKSLKAHFEASYKSMESLNGFLLKFRLNDSVCNFLTASTANSMRALSETFKSTTSVYGKGVETLQQAIIFNLGGRIKHAIKDLREHKRQFDKVMERYDHALVKYGAMSKSKEASAVVEESFQLYELRKGYLKSSFDVTWRIYEFENTVNACFFEIVRLCSANCTDYSQMAQEVFSSFDLMVQEHQKRVEEQRKEDGKIKAKFDAFTKALTDEKVAKFRPSPEIPLPSQVGSMMRPNTGQGGTSSAIATALSSTSNVITGLATGGSVTSPVSTLPRYKGTRK